MGIEFNSVRMLARDLGRVPVELRAELRPKLLEAGEIVARRARANASWSTRIPDAIKVQALFGRLTGGAVVRVDRSKAPHARALEGLSVHRGTLRRTGGTFRHPVFGDRGVWVDQPTRPYLLPAADAARGDVQDRVADAVRSATRHLNRSY
jgi:Bacteriophage HK97-gp10, putative tail-component